MTILVESHNAAIEHLTENGTTERYRIGDEKQNMVNKELLNNLPRACYPTIIIY